MYDAPVQQENVKVGEDRFGILFYLSWQITVCIDKAEKAMKLTSYGHSEPYFLIPLVSRQKNGINAESIIIDCFC